MAARCILLLLFAVALFGVQPSMADSFTVEEWHLATGVEGAPGSDWRFSTMVQNPFQASHFATSGNSTASSVFDFAWAAQFGSFLIEGTHQAEDIGADATSSGLIYFDAAVDLVFTIDLSYTYNLPGGAMRAGFTAAVLDADTQEAFFGVSEHGDTWSGGPVSDTLTAQGSGILPAGRSYAIQYKLELDTYSSSGILGTAFGYVDFTLAPVPEPSTLALLAMFTLTVPRRRHRLSRISML